jgi:hypothetical protein
MALPCESRGIIVAATWPFQWFFFTFFILLYASRHIVWRKGVYRVDYRQWRCSPPFASLQVSRGGILLARNDGLKTLSCSRYVTTVFHGRFWLVVFDMLVPFKGKRVKPWETIESLRQSSIAFADALDSKSCTYFPYKYSMSQWTQQWWLLFNCSSHYSWNTDVSMENHLSYAQWGSSIRTWCCIQSPNPGMDFVPISSLLCSLATQAVSKGCQSLSSSFIEWRLWIWCD